MELQLRIDARVAVLSWSNPKHRNALDDEMLAALTHRLEELARDDAVDAIVLTGEGGTFSSGGSLESIASLAMAARADDGVASVAGRMRRNARVVEQLAVQPQMTIALVEGAVVGAGLGLMLACDLRIASEDSKFIPGYGALALTTDVGTGPGLARVIGPAAAQRWLAQGTKLSAEQALAAGLVDSVAPAPTPEVDAATRELRAGDGARIGSQRAALIDPELLAAELDREALAFARSVATAAAQQRIRALTETRRSS